MGVLILLLVLFLLGCVVISVVSAVARGFRKASVPRGPARRVSPTARQPHAAPTLMPGRRPPPIPPAPGQPNPPHPPTRYLVCVCGAEFLPSQQFCPHCGAPRSSARVVTG